MRCRSARALNLSRPEAINPTRRAENLVRIALKDAEQDGVLKYLASTYDPSSDRMQSGLGATGPRALTFAPLLGSQTILFKQVVERLLELAKDDVSEFLADSPYASSEIVTVSARDGRGRDKLLEIVDGKPLLRRTASAALPGRRQATAMRPLSRSSWPARLNCTPWRSGRAP